MPVYPGALKLLGFSCTVVQLPFLILSRFCVDKRDVLIARVIIHAYNDHVGSFLPSQWSSTNHSVLGSKEPTLLCNQVKWYFICVISPIEEWPQNELGPQRAQH